MPLTHSTTEQDMPQWQRDYYAALLANSNRLAQVSYQPYGGQRLAPLPADLAKAHAIGKTGRGVQEPFLKRGQRMTEEASGSFPDQYKNYMNPYMREVVDRIRDEGLRTYKEHVLPGLENKFMKLGTYGSGQHKELTQRASRDVQNEILGNQQKALASGYQQAGQIFNADKARQLESAKEMAALGGMTQSGQLADMGVLENQGRYQQQQQQALMDLQYQDFLRQSDYPYEKLAQHANIMQGTPTPTISQTFQSTPGTPQLNTLANLGNLATSLGGAYFASRKKKGGHVKGRRRNA